MHLAAGIWIKNKDMRLDKSLKINLKTTSGAEINTSLRYQNK